MDSTAHAMRVMQQILNQDFVKQFHVVQTVNLVDLMHLLLALIMIPVYVIILLASVR
jgi:hypothetical protein